MKLLRVTSSAAKDKRFAAVFADGEKRITTNFGSKGKAYIDHNNEALRRAYLARHRVNEDWSDPVTAGSLSRWILWGPYKTYSENLKAFKKRFNL
jgi:hypothetical protein